jgi:hypothetical protein
MKHAFAWLFHVTDEILFFFAELVTSIAIYSVFVITFLKLRYDDAIATDRDALSQKTNLIELFEALLTDTLFVNGIILKIESIKASNTYYSAIIENNRILAAG